MQLFFNVLRRILTRRAQQFHTQTDISAAQALTANVGGNIQAFALIRYCYPDA